MNKKSGGLLLGHGFSETAIKSEHKNAAVIVNIRFYRLGMSKTESRVSGFFYFYFFCVLLFDNFCHKSLDNKIFEAIIYKLITLFRVYFMVCRYGNEKYPMLWF